MFNNYFNTHKLYFIKQGKLPVYILSTKLLGND